MSYRSLALAIAFSATPIATAAAQSVYVAPGGVYVGAGPVYVIPAPNNGNGPYPGPVYGAPGNGYGPTVVVPQPVYPPPVYNGAGYNGAGYNGAGYAAPPAYYLGDPVLRAYAGPRRYVDELAPRPPVAIPYGGRCYGRFGAC